MGKKERGKERKAQKAQKLKLQQEDTVGKSLSTAKVHMQIEASLASSHEEKKILVQKSNTPKLVHTRAIEIAIHEKTWDTLELLCVDFATQYSELTHQVQTSILTNIDTSFKFSQIENILNTLKVDLSRLPPVPKTTETGAVIKANGAVIEVNIAIPLMEVVHQHWGKNQNTAIQILKLFISKNLSTSEPEARNNVLLSCVNNYHHDINFIKMLLNSEHFNVNTVSLPGSAYGLQSLYAMTPFSIAYSRLNMELMQVLLEYSADPYLAKKRSLKNIKTQLASLDLSYAIDQAMVAHPLGVHKLSAEQRQQYFIDVDCLIKNFFLNKAEKMACKSLQEEKQRHATECNEQITPKNLAKKKVTDHADIKKDTDEELMPQGAPAAEQELPPKESPAAEQELPPKGAPADAEARPLSAPDIQTSETEFLDQFIESQERSARNRDLPEEIREERKFDALVLRYIKTRENADLEKISELLSGLHSVKNSGYYVKVLIELGASMEDAGVILATTPRLLHKFCTVQKETQSSASIAAEPEEPIFGDNVYSVAGTKIFLQINSELMAELPADHQAKLHNQLSSPKFIAKNSSGLSGVKNYGHNISKLKIVGLDSNLVSTLRYKDNDGNLLIVFNQFLSHKESDTLQRGKCIKVGHIQEVITSVITEESPLEQESVGGLLPSAQHNDDGVELCGDGPE